MPSPEPVTALPLVVESVTRYAGATWTVTVRFADGTTQSFLVPETLATLQGVTISALAYAMLAERSVPVRLPRSSKHRRYAPRP